jgi:hypothetical protein
MGKDAPASLSERSEPSCASMTPHALGIHAVVTPHPRSEGWQGTWDVGESFENREAPEFMLWLHAIFMPFAGFMECYQHLWTGYPQVIPMYRVRIVDIRTYFLQ